MRSCGKTPSSPRTLQWVHDDHDEWRLPYAVVGGHAVAAWVSQIEPAAVRTTVDVDLLVARGDFEAVKAALEEAGFIHSFTFGIDIFVDGPQGKARAAVHILYAGERVKPADRVPGGQRQESVEPDSGALRMW